MEMKYIIVEIEGNLVPVMFGEAISHKAMYRGLQRGLREDSRDSGRGFGAVMLDGAGFVGGLAATSVYGESESLRYGVDYVPKELHHLTKSKPEDLTVINGGRTPEVVQAKRDDDAGNRQKEKLAKVIAILKKEAPEAKHKSPKGRWEAAMGYLMQTHQMSLVDANNFVAETSVAFCPGAYKIS